MLLYHIAFTTIYRQQYVVVNHITTIFSRWVGSSRFEILKEFENFLFSKFDDQNTNAESEIKRVYQIKD